MRTETELCLNVLCNECCSKQATIVVLFVRIRKVNKRNRVAWCRGKQYLPVDGYWNRVIFSDESKVEIGLDNRVYIWRRAGEEWLFLHLHLSTSKEATWCNDLGMHYI